MIDVPQSTVEKPLTAIDYIAALDQCASISDVKKFSQGVPEHVRNDDRFARSVAARLGAIKSQRRGKA